jgi:hypothetical protein
MEFWNEPVPALARKNSLLSLLFFYALLGLSALALAQTPKALGNFDGPAELPRVSVKTALADTPAPGKQIVIKSGDDLQSALDNASCGDTIKLEAAATFSGHFHLPNKSCDDAHWIIIRTAAPDGTLPPEGTRISPCYAGVSSLPGRPAFHCASANNVMAKLAFPGRGGNGPIYFSEGANHYRFIGVEITRDPSTASITALAAPDGQVAADHIIFDRVWMHGNAQDETRRGLFLSGTTYMAVVDSYFSDFHCIAREGSCTDSQTISGAGGDLPMGPFKIVNNFLEASGENILFGGTRATKTPTDIVIRHNHLFKPLIWKKDQPGFVGGPKGNPFIVKNLFELKNAQRVLFEGNILENNWGGFSQTGFAVVLTPRNQYNDAAHSNLCPLCLVADITIRNCFIAHVASGFQVANMPNPDGTTSSGGERYSIHSLVIDDMDGEKYEGFGAFMLLISNRPVLKDVRIEHVTAVSSRVLFNMGIKQGHAQNFVFVNNLVGANGKQITSTGGGPENCVFQPDKVQPLNILKDCFDSYTVTNNAIVNGYGLWPPGNFSPRTIGSIDFAKGGQGIEAYRLCREKNPSCKNVSKYVDAGTDHKDLGADIEAILSATRGVAD